MKKTQSMTEKQKKEFLNGVESISLEVLSTNHNLIRWPEYPLAHGYNELAKQSLNMITTFILVKCAKEKGMSVDETRIPCIAVKRLIEKTINGDIRDDHISEICALGGLDKSQFDRLMEDKILGKMPFLSQKLLEVKDDWIETQIYKIATKMASLIELGELAPNDEVTKAQLYAKLSSYREKFPDLVAIALNSSGPEVQFLREVSKLRWAIRWLKQFRATNCSVLEHLGETAIFAWLMSIEKQPEDEIKAAELFWCGLFHDLPERWTGDMASPVKDSIEGLREATEKFENLMMEQHVYSVLPEVEGNAIKAVMGNIEQNYLLIKGADYVSATMECFRNIMCGSRDDYFINVLIDYVTTKDKFSEIFGEFITRITKKVLTLR